jgi:hypothetical protein
VAHSQRGSAAYKGAGADAESLAEKPDHISDFSARLRSTVRFMLRPDFAMVAHGHVTIVDADHPDFVELEATQVQSGNQSVREWQGHGVYLHLEPTSIYTFARDPDQYPA